MKWLARSAAFPKTLCLAAQRTGEAPQIHFRVGHGGPILTGGGTDRGETVILLLSSPSVVKRIAS